MNKFIKKLAPDFAQIESWLNQANKDLVIAKKILSLDPKWSLTVAYQAMLRIGRALMFAYGYLPTNYRQHKTVVEFTAKHLDKNFQSVTNQFERLRRKRHDFFYGTLIGVSSTEAKEALKTAQALFSQVKIIVAKRDPQTKLI